MYDHILVPVAIDHTGRGSAALSVAELLLNEGGRITILHVQEAIPSYVESYIPEEVFERNRQEMKGDLNTLAKEATKPTDIAIINGHAGRAIVEYGANHEVDCIVLASHHPGFADVFIGSTAGWVARHADCGVHIIR